MDIRLRWGLFILFTSLFVIGAPAIVLYTAGYNYNPRAGQIMRSGGLSVASMPRNASIYLNGELMNEETPYVFKRLRPDTYTLELKREGFHDWSGRVDINQGSATYVQDVLLLQNIEPELISETPKNTPSVHPNGTHVVYTTQEAGWTDIWLLTLKNGDLKNIGRLPNEPEDIAIDWSVNGEYISVLAGERIRFFTTRGNQLNFTELPTTIRSVRWHPTNDNLLYADGHLSTVEFNMENLALQELRKNTLLRLDQDLLYIEEVNGLPTLVRASATDTNFIATLPRTQYNVEALIDTFILLSDDRNTLIGIDLNAKRPIRFRDDVTDFAVFDNGSILLYTNGIELNMYERATNRVTFITRQSEEIRNVAWHPSGLRFLVSDDQGIDAFDRSLIAKQRDVDNLVTEADIEKFWMSGNGEILYYYGTIEGKTGIFTQKISR